MTQTMMIAMQLAVERIHVAAIHKYTIIHTHLGERSQSDTRICHTQSTKVSKVIEHHIGIFQLYIQVFLHITYTGKAFESQLALQLTVQISL